jgi:DNA-binding MarR family transcriptional regulator
MALGARFMAVTLDYRDDKSLTLGAKGLYAMLLKWQTDHSGDLDIREIVRLTADNESTIKRVLKELETKGYIRPRLNGNSISIDGTRYDLPKQ